ncbi:MAG: hypothetical protein WBL20_05420 [Sphingobium sp.]|uniref:hypothetical protein n=1 Tax=Sphingobium sp. TaxID=1912891 RepID=UPI003BAF743D
MLIEGTNDHQHAEFDLAPKERDAADEAKVALQPRIVYVGDERVRIQSEYARHR